jgi:hypothetical protein
MEFDCCLYGLYIGSNQGVGLLMRLYRFSSIAFGDVLVKDTGYTIYKDTGYTKFNNTGYTIFNDAGYIISNDAVYTIYIV